MTRLLHGAVYVAFIMMPLSWINVVDLGDLRVSPSALSLLLGLAMVGVAFRRPTAVWARVLALLGAVTGLYLGAELLAGPRATFTIVIASVVMAFGALALGAAAATGIRTMQLSVSWLIALSVGSFGLVLWRSLGTSQLLAGARALYRGDVPLLVDVVRIGLYGSEYFDRLGFAVGVNLHNRFAHHVVSLGTVWLAVATTTPRWRRLGYLLYVLLAALAVLLGSGQALATILIALAVYGLVLVRRRGMQLTRPILLVAVFAFAARASGIDAAVRGLWAERFESDPTTGRSRIFREFGTRVTDSFPLPVPEKLPGDPHSVALTLSWELGLFGFLLYLSALLAAVAITVHLLRHPRVRSTGTPFADAVSLSVPLQLAVVTLFAGGLGLPGPNELAKLVALGIFLGVLHEAPKGALVASPTTHVGSPARAGATAQLALTRGVARPNRRPSTR